MFKGFPREGLDLLRDLPSFDKAAFETHRPEYQAFLQEPVKRFVDALGTALRDAISPGIQFAAKTHGSIGPINNDVRFDPGKPTYKDHILLRFWEGETKKTSPTLFVRLTGVEVGFASGVMPADVQAWRAAVDAHGADLEIALARVTAAADADVVGQELKRVPAPFDPDHAHEALLRHKWLQLRWPRALPDAVRSEAFVDYCVGELSLAGDVHRWLVEHL